MRAILLIAIVVLTGCGAETTWQIDTGEYQRVAVEISAETIDGGARQQVEAAWYWCSRPDGGYEAKLYHQPCAIVPAGN